MLEVEVSKNNLIEKTHIIGILLTNFLGVDFRLKICSHDFIKIKKSDKFIRINSTFFDKILPKNSWLSDHTLPIKPLKTWNSNESTLLINQLETEVPIIYGEEFLKVRKDHIDLGIDIFGSSFFMLSRYEEAVKTSRDIHKRFPVKSSLAYQENFIHRPLVNEYLEILWSCMHTMWPNLKRKQRTFRTLVSCDVDHINHRPSNYFMPFVKNLAKNLLKDNSLRMAILTITGFIRVGLLKMKKFDPYNTFDFSMDVCESNNIKQAFYFIADHTAGDIDGHYEIDGADARDLLNRISNRGHEIGIHLSYNAYNQHSQSIKEMTRLRNVLKEEGIEADAIGGRNHYLRWDSLTSPLIWEKIGGTYDSTLGYADIIGFRSSTCYEYPLYDLKNRKPLSVIEHPLLIMDSTLLLEKYMGLSYAESLAAATDLKNICKKFEGDFTFLWHNSSFLTNENKQLFTAIIES